jgi:cyclohexa-1,5-dienecarbonyl-CoA hydratase
MSVQTTIHGGVARIVLDSPPLNILTRDVLARLRRELVRLAEEPSLRVLLLTATGRHFSAGADVGEHLPPHHLSLIPEFLETVQALDAFPLPVIAAVRGKCLGGGFELVQPVDLIVAGESASFGQPEILLGVFPPAACVLLAERLPPSLAARVVYTGDPLSAADAERHGLVIQVVPDDRVDETGVELARRIAKHSGAALRVTKRALRGGGGDGSRSAAVRHAALREAGHRYLHELMVTHDAVEGLRAFTEKRVPEWRHA